MRLTVDALVARPGRGLGTYVHNLIAAWAELAPTDELTVITTTEFADLIRMDVKAAHHKLVAFKGRPPEAVWRLARTELLLPTIVRASDALLSAIPAIPARCAQPSVAVVADLRYEDRPDDFGRLQRVVRTARFTAGYARATLLLPISHRTAKILIHHHPHTARKVKVVYLGADHIPLMHSARTGDVIAFGHNSGKHPELLLGAWHYSDNSHMPRLPPLRIVGVPDRHRPALMRLCDALELRGRVFLEPFLSDIELHRLMSVASALVLPSRYEGFGLPVLEGMRAGVPVAIAPDPAVIEVAGIHAACATEWSPRAISDAVRQALAMTSEQVSAAQDHASTFTWKRTAGLTREAVVRAIRCQSTRDEALDRGLR